MLPDGDLRLVPLHLGRRAPLLDHAQQRGVPPRLLVNTPPSDAQPSVRPSNDGEDGPHLGAERPQVELRQLPQTVLPPMAPSLLLRPGGRVLALPLSVVLLSALHRTTLLQPLTAAAASRRAGRVSEAGFDLVQALDHGLVDAERPVVGAVQDADQLRGRLRQDGRHGAADGVAGQEVAWRSSHLHVTDLHLEDEHSQSANRALNPPSNQRRERQEGVKPRPRKDQREGVSEQSNEDLVVEMIKSLWRFKNTVIKNFFPHYFHEKCVFDSQTTKLLLRPL